MTASLNAPPLRPPAIDETAPIWTLWALAAIAGAVALRIGVNALELMPLHFDESQYWTYGEELAGGYYSKPPMTAWMIRLSTEMFGDTVFGVRFFAPIIHGLIAWLLFATGRRMFDDRTGFWAALAYLTLPAVSASSGLMTTDPPMMAAWAAALYCLVRALEADRDAGRAGAPLAGWPWWLAMGAALGFGFLSKYTIIAFVGGVIGYALFSRQGGWGTRPTRLAGPLLAVLSALVVFSPNLLWNAANDFASITHVGDNAKLGDGPAFDFSNAAEFAGAQIAIFGPLLMLGLVLMVAKGRWREEYGYRLLLWLALPLILAMIVQAFLSRAHPNWAAPAYIAATLAVVAWLLDRERRAWLVASIAIGIAAQIALVALGGTYAAQHTELPRQWDPYKKMRPNPPTCGKALLRRGSDQLLSDDRRLLADCMFAGELGTQEIRIWNPDGAPGNHYELTSSLTAADADQPFLLVLKKPESEAKAFLERFETALIMEAGAIRTHADRTSPYTIARVQGFKGYTPAE